MMEAHKLATTPLMYHNKFPFNISLYGCTNFLKKIDQNYYLEKQEISFCMKIGIFQRFEGAAANAAHLLRALQVSNKLGNIPTVCDVSSQALPRDINFPDFSRPVGPRALWTKGLVGLRAFRAPLYVVKLSRFQIKFGIFSRDTLECSANLPLT